MYNTKNFDNDIERFLFDIKANKNIDIKTEKAYKSDLTLLANWCVVNDFEFFDTII